MTTARVVTRIASPIQALRSRLERDPEAAALRREAEARRQLARELTEEARYYAALIEDRLERMDLCYRFTVSEGKRQWKQGVQRVRIKEAHCPRNGEAIYLRVDTLRMPRRIRTVDLEDPEVIRDLTLVCRRQVTAKYDVRSGFWFIVERKAGARGIPSLVRYSDMLAHMPKDAPPLAIPLGCGENGRLKYADLADMPHLIVAGTSGGGKSVFLNALVCTLIQRNPPEKLRMQMIDFKGGVEFAVFREIPHLDVFVKDLDEIVPMLAALHAEVDRRLEKFEGVAKSISSYNYKHPKHKLPYIVLVIDEMATLASPAMPRGARREAEAYLAQLGAKARATGIHLVLCTQHPCADVCAGILKANFPSRIAFNTSSNSDSIVIIGTGDAYQLSPKGRMFMVSGSDRMELQAPYISEAMSEEICRDVRAGKVDLERRSAHDVTVEELMLAALHEFGGDFNEERLWRMFKARKIGRDEIRLIADQYVGVQLELDGQWYHLVPRGKGKPSQLEQVVIPEDEPDVARGSRLASDLAEPYKADQPAPAITPTNTTITVEGQGEPVVIEWVSPTIPEIADAPPTPTPAPPVVDRPADMNDQDAVMAWLASPPEKPKKRGGR